MKKYLGNIFKIVVFLVVIGAFYYYVSKNLPTIIKTFDTTTSNLTFSIVFAGIIILFSYYFIVKMQRVLFEEVGIKKTFFQALKLFLSQLSASVIVPTGGASSVLVYNQDAKRNNNSQTDTLAVVLISLIIFYISTGILLAFSLIYLQFVKKSIDPFLTIPAIIFYVFTTSVIILTYLSSKKPQLMVYLINLLQKIRYKFKTKKGRRKKQIDPNDLLDKFSEAFELIILHPVRFIESLSLVLLCHAIRIVGLYIIFLSFGITINIVPLLVAYGIGMMFVIISPSPQGVGFVEAGMAYTFTKFNIPQEVSATVIIIYRGFEFWIPFLIGFVFLQLARLKDKKVFGVLE